MKPIFGKRAIAALLPAALGFWAAPLSARDATGVNPQDPRDSLEEVIVTATRRAENIQDVSGVVQAFDRETLRQDGITELRQLQLAVPGMSIANQEGNVEVYIRGVGSANNTELGDPATAPPHQRRVYSTPARAGGHVLRY